jgi:hypothetical protein
MEVRLLPELPPGCGVLVRDHRFPFQCRTTLKYALVSISPAAQQSDRETHDTPSRVLKALLAVPPGFGRPPPAVPMQRLVEERLGFTRKHPHGPAV